MTATDITETAWDGEGQPPIHDAGRLRARIEALEPERQQSLAEAWAAQGIGAFPDELITADRYRQVQRLVAAFEPSAPVTFEHNLLAEQLYALPEHIYKPATEALAVYAGMEDPRTFTIVSTGQLEEVRRIIGEAVAYAEAQADAVANPDNPEGFPDETFEATPTVADLPPVDDTAEWLASDDYPGNKAKADQVLAWVNHPASRQELEPGDRTVLVLNRAARAYALEQDRSTVRKGLSAKLVDILGPEGLAQVQGALAAAAPPPIDLGGTPPAPPSEADTEATPSASAVEVAGPEVGASVAPADVTVPDVAVEAAPATSTPPADWMGGELQAIANPGDEDHDAWVAKVKAAGLTSTPDPYVGAKSPSLERREAIEAIADLHRRLASAYDELAKVLA